MLQRGGSLWKRVPAALLFTTGVFLVAFTPGAEHWRVCLFPAALFFGLCLSNLMLIESWENRRTTTYPTVICSVLAVVSAVCVPLTPWYAAILLSAVLLLAIHMLRMRFSLAKLRVLADAALVSAILLYQSYLFVLK